MSVLRSLSFPEKLGRRRKRWVSLLVSRTWTHCDVSWCCCSVCNVLVILSKDKLSPVSSLFLTLLLFLLISSSYFSSSPRPVSPRPVSPLLLVLFLLFSSSCFSSSPCPIYPLSPPFPSVTQRKFLLSLIHRGRQCERATGTEDRSVEQRQNPVCTLNF